MRVHVVGDCKTDATAKIVGTAMVDFENRSGKDAWTYTHAWKDVAIKSWNGAKVLASCETGKEVSLARSLGYATVLVVPEHLSNKMYSYDGESVIPCPEQLGKTDCAHCNLCMIPDKLMERKLSIGFAAHGIQKNKVKDILVTKLN